MAGERICLDAFNLSMPKGSGIATYARNLAAAVTGLGYEAQLLFGPEQAPGGDNLLNEALIFDAPRPPAKEGRKRWWPSLSRRRREDPRATRITCSGEVIGGLGSDGAAGARVGWAAQDVFHGANRHHGQSGEITALRFGAEQERGLDLMHWTCPLPIRAQAIPNVYTIHDLVPLRLPYATLDNKRRFHALCQSICREADHVVAVSETTRQDVIRMFGLAENRITNTFQSVSLPASQRNRPQAEVAAEIEGVFALPWRGYFVFYGAIEPKKNLARLVEAYLASAVAAPLVIVGGQTWLAETQAGLLDFLATGPGSAGSGRIRRYDYLPAAALMTLVSGARATLFPSLYEGFGLPVVESMLLGTPVLGGAAGAVPEIAGDAALLVDPYDVTAIKRAIQALDADEALRADLAARGTLQAARFAPERYCRAPRPGLWFAPVTAGPHILFDATRLANRRRRSAPTGIDRVVLAYARWLQQQTLAPFTPVVSWSGRLTRMSRRRFDRLVAEAAIVEQEPGADAGREALWRALRPNILAHPHAGPTSLDALRSENTPAGPGPVRRAVQAAAKFVLSRLAPGPRGSLYLNVGHSGLDRPGFVASLAGQGLSIAVMIHDLIPITHPEFCGPGAAERHVRRVEAVLAHADLVIANSRATAQEIAAYARGWERREPPVSVALLGLEPAFFATPRRAPPAAPYFVFVGTIEARKNLALLLTVWRRLADRMGAATPHLVLAGRRGWENEAVLDHLHRSQSVRRLVHEVAGLGDEELAELLSGARALIAPSLAEGFDLPIAEAQSLGVPVIASDIAVHRELAADASLIDPLDGPGWLAAIEAACAARPSRATSRPPTWDSHFETVAAALGLATDAAPPTARARYG